MPTAGLALVLAAALCHAIWNVAVKRIGGGAELLWLFSLFAILFYLPLAVWVVVVTSPHFGSVQLLFMLGTVILHLGYMLLLQTGYRNGDLSLVYPTARATGPLLSTSFAVVFLGEVVTWQMALGAGVIVFGIFMMTGGTGARVGRASASLLYGLAVGVVIGSYTAWDAYAVSELLVPPILQDYVTHVGRALLLAPVANRRRAAVREHWRNHKAGVLAIAVFCPLGYILVLYALTFTPLAYVAPTREVSVVLTVLAGSLLLGEGHVRRRLGWASAIVAGLAILVTARGGG